jgi:multiple sugar transport system permease protein
MAPTLIAMFLVIALPIVSIIVQSLHIEHPAVLRTTETCQPFGGCVTETNIDAAATAALRAAEPLGRFNGIATHLGRNHLAVEQIGAVLAGAEGPAEALRRVYDLPLCRALALALAFTLTYSLLVTPSAMALGLAIPIVLLVMFFQRHLVSGLTAGAMQG